MKSEKYGSQPELLRLCCEDEEALIKSIEIVFDVTAPFPHFLDGRIDLLSGYRKGCLIIGGVKEISIEFHEKAFQ